MVPHDRFTDLRRPPSAIARSPMIEHDIMRRVREWMAGGPPPHGLPFSSANLQTRGAQPRTALTKPPFSWIDHLIRSLQERRRDRQAEGLGGLEVERQREARWSFDGNLRRRRTRENLERNRPGLSVHGHHIRAVRNQAAVRRVTGEWNERRQTVARGKFANLPAAGVENRRG